MENTNEVKSEKMSEEQKQFFIQRYDFIYRELNKLQDGMSKMEIETTKLLEELQTLRAKERQFEE